MKGISIALDELIALRAYAQQFPWLNQSLVATSQADQHVSTRRGRGIDFAEVRAYQVGDDVRHIDWRVTARSGKPHTKLYSEERERPLYLLIDLTSTMYFGTRVCFKSLLAIKAAALLGWAAINQGQRLGALVVTDEAIYPFKARSRKQGILPLLTLLAELSGKLPVRMTGQSNQLEAALKQMRLLLKSGGLFVMMSDFHAIDDALFHPLAILRKSSDCIALHIYDPLEMMAPPANRYMVTDGQQSLVFNTSSKTVRQRYQQHFENKLATLTRQMLQLQIPLLHLSTATPVVQALRNYRAQMQLNPLGMQQPATAHWSR